MKKNSILIVLLLGLMHCSVVAVDAAKPLRRSVNKRVVAAAGASTKVTTELPSGFGIESLISYKKEWECYSFREDASKALLEVGFTVLKKGRSKELVGTDNGGTYQKASNVTYGFEGIKVTLLRGEQIENIIFPNKQTLNQFIATALDSGIYTVSDWSPTRYNNKTGLGSFNVEGLKIVFDWNP